MAQGFETFAKAKAYAQEEADRTKEPISIYRTNGKTYHWSVRARYGARGKVMTIQPAA